MATTGQHQDPARITAARTTPWTKLDLSRVIHAGSEVYTLDQIKDWMQKMSCFTFLPGESGTLTLVAINRKYVLWLRHRHQAMAWILRQQTLKMLRFTPRWDPVQLHQCKPWMIWEPEDQMEGDLMAVFLLGVLDGCSKPLKVFQHQPVVK